MARCTVRNARRLFARHSSLPKPKRKVRRRQMIKHIDAQRCMGFLEVVRTMIDEAEFSITGATLPGDSAKALSRASAEIVVASKNLAWISEEIVRIANAQG